ncbi:MAG: sugar phosphate nucleotidyltransferase [Candidatus Hydrothermarchaeota archaeon]
MKPNVTGIILAGGYGKRLLPLTETTPKPLLELKPGYTILDKQILDLKYAGIRKVYLLIGHLGGKIKERFGQSYKGVKIEYLEEEKPRGTLWALSNALKHTKTDVIVRNGDVVSDINTKNLVLQAQKGEGLITIAVTKMQSPYGIIEFSDRRITSFQEKPVLDLYINAGIYYIRRDAFSLFQKRYERKEVENTVFQTLVEERKASPYYEAGAFWRSVDGIKDLEMVRKEFEARNDKPWGYERVIVNNENYLVKELYIRKGFRTSIHYHPSKDESMHVLEGEGYIDFPKDKKRTNAGVGNVIRIEPKNVHSIVALENLRIYEYSTPHPEDTVRVKDYYER